MSQTVTQPITVRIDKAKVAELDALAKATERSRAWHVEQALAAYLDLQAWQIEQIKTGLAQLEAGEGIPQEEIEAEFERREAEARADQEA